MASASDTPGRAVTARLRGVHKSYGPVRVLDLPELDLYAGQVVGVVGENGAGKSTLMGTLAGPTRQMIEVAKAWGREPRLLILDEPTSSLGPVEAGMVLGLARRLADEGGTVLFIGHRLDEVREVSDRILVLRNGMLVADL